jgi:hypothetical protein
VSSISRVLRPELVKCTRRTSVSSSGEIKICVVVRIGPSVRSIRALSSVKETS